MIEVKCQYKGCGKTDWVCMHEDAETGELHARCPNHHSHVLGHNSNYTFIATDGAVYLS